MSISPSFHQDRDAKQSMATSAVPKLLIVDPIPFRGGSKIATEAMLAELHQRMPHAELHVVTQDGDSWPQCQHYRFGIPRLLLGRKSGIGYLLSQSWKALQIVWLAWRLGGVTCLLAASGPGVDLCCYWAARLLRLPVVQLIHGPVYCSGLSARALWQATRVFYLESCRPSLNAILERLGKDDFPNSWQPFRNGLSEAVWPRQGEGGSGILWAASLLRWKGLETMLAAHQQMGHLRPILTVCYLLPKGIALPCSTPQPELPDTRWYQAPADLDMIRSHCGIFVSTSHLEPFGLSILEAMAAGLCVVIPADGAFWDGVLRDGIDCCKYQPGDAADLAQVLSTLAAQPERARLLGMAGQQVAYQHYRATTCYAAVVTALAYQCGETE